MLVLIPGLLCDDRLWSSQIAGLQTRADIVVADITRQSTISEMADDILRRSPGRFALAGFSLGSQVALQIMSVAGERVERLALLSATRGGLPPAVGTAIQRAVNVIETRGLDEYLEQAFPTYVAVSNLGDAGLKRSFFDMAHSVGRDAGLRQMRALLALATPFPNLHKISCPTVVIGGREDRRTTPHANEELAREIPGSRLVMVDGAAHFTPLEQPEIVTDVLRRWLAA